MPLPPSLIVSPFKSCFLMKEFYLDCLRVVVWSVLVVLWLLVFC